MHVGIYLFILAPLVVLAAVFALLHYLQSPSKDVPCWQIQKVDGRVFKLNVCTGETDELPATAPTQQGPAKAKGTS